jgi:hypothetical protein
MFSSKTKQTLSPEVAALIREGRRLEIARAKLFIRQAELSLKITQARHAGDEKRIAELDQKICAGISEESSIEVQLTLLTKKAEELADALEALTR